MSVPPFLEVNGATNILFLFSLLDMCLINNIFLVAVVFYWTFFFLIMLAIATSFVGVLFSSDDFAVVAFDGSGNIFAGAVGYFYCVTVDDFPQGVSCWKAIFNQLEEFGTNFGLHCLVPGRVEPEYIVSAVFLFTPGWLVGSGFFIF